MDVPALFVIILLATGFLVVWISPGMLSWIAAVALARKEALRTQRVAKAWFLARFGED